VRGAPPHDMIVPPQQRSQGLCCPYSLHVARMVPVDLWARRIEDCIVPISCTLRGRVSLGFMGVSWQREAERPFGADPTEAHAALPVAICTSAGVARSPRKVSTSIGQTVTQMPQPIQEELALFNSVRLSA